jgi:Flp pilus assembly protein TadB
MDVLAAISAAISAVISIVALVVSWRVARRQTAIQERVAAIEEARRAEEVEARARARVTASLMHEQRDPRRRVTRLVLHNEGPALARGVEVELEEGQQIPGIIGIEALPVDLQPGQRMPFIVSVGLADAMTFRVTVRWTDEAGGHEEPFTLSIL